MRQIVILITWALGIASAAAAPEIMNQGEVEAEKQLIVINIIMILAIVACMIYVWVRWQKVQKIVETRAKNSAQLRKAQSRSEN